MKNKMSVIILFIIVSSSCINEDAMICSKLSVDPKYEHFNTLIWSEGDLFVFGTDEEKNDFRTKRSVVYKRSNVSGTKLRILDVELNGENVITTKGEKYIYLVNESFTERLSFKNIYSSLYRFNPNDYSINKITDFGGYLVRDLLFEDDLKGYAFVRLSNNARDYGLLFTDDGGTSWDTLMLKRPVEKVFQTNDKLYFTSFKINNFRNWIYSINKKDRSIDSLQVSFNISGIHVEKNVYWLLGKENDLTILKRYDRESVQDVHIFGENSGLFPKRLYKYGNLIAVLLSTVDKYMLGGLGGTKEELYLSFDAGITWKRHELNDALYINPLSFDRDKKFAAYIGNGKVILCDLTK